MWWITTTPPSGPWLIGLARYASISSPPSPRMVTVSASVASYIGFPSHRATNGAQILPPGSSGLAGADALDDAEREPLGFLDQEAEFGQVGSWPAAEVLARERDGDPLVQPLHPPQQRCRRGHVIDQQEAAARAQDPCHLGDRAPVVGDGAQPERAQHGVERPVRELQCLGITMAQVGIAAEGGRAL